MSVDKDHYDKFDEREPESDAVERFLKRNGFTESALGRYYQGSNDESWGKGVLKRHVGDSKGVYVRNGALYRYRKMQYDYRATKICEFDDKFELHRELGPVLEDLKNDKLKAELKEAWKGAVRKYGKILDILEDDEDPVNVYGVGLIRCLEKLNKTEEAERMRELAETAREWSDQSFSSAKKDWEEDIKHALAPSNSDN